MFRNYIDRFLTVLIILSVLQALTACGRKAYPVLTRIESPPAPAMLSAIHREGDIILKWDFPEAKEASVSGFHIFKSSDGTFEKIAFKDKNERSFMDPDFKTGHKYVYKVVAQSSEGVYSDDSRSITVTPLNPPYPPKDVAIKIESDGVRLSWETADRNALCNVYRSSVKGKYGLSPVNNYPLSVNFFLDKTIFKAPAYYTIRCQRDSEVRDEGRPSEEVAVKPNKFTPSPVKGLRYFADSKKVILYWEAPPETWITGFRIYRRTDSRGFILIGETVIPSFIDSRRPLAGTAYRVSAVGPAKEGPPAETKGIMYVPGQ